MAKCSAINIGVFIVRIATFEQIVGLPKIALFSYFSLLCNYPFAICNVICPVASYVFIFSNVNFEIFYLCKNDTSYFVIQIFYSPPKLGFTTN